jgi:hypothetical protein
LRRRQCCHPRIVLAKRKTNGLAVIDLGWCYTDKGSDLIRGLFGAGELHPLLDARIELVPRNILRSDGPSFGPIACKAMSER